ncbi:MAG: LuxR C-terminal-related transcriptional regulator [Anaerolineae bacterium]
MLASVILQTKLTPPPVRSDRVQRPRLTDRFNAVQQHPLTLVCAPAGYGKSSLLAEWFSADAGKTSAYSWLSLDEDDNDPIRFLTYMITAAAHASGIDASEILASLNAPQPPSIKAVIAALISTLETFPRPLALVLDDYHRISSSQIHEAMIYLLDHLPSRLRVVITSREDPPFPLARLRGRGHLLEIRADDLRFTLKEAEQFLWQMLGISLSSEQISKLETRTEGWIAGLQLAALAMKGRDNLDAFIAAFTGSHRFILDYLSQEVLSRQPESVRQFLLQTSILNRFCAPLCDALTGRNDGQSVLEQLEHGNLFLISLDDERYWYRYHHLFSDMLRRQLQHSNPDLVTELHRRAARWCEQNGWVAEALEHALQSRDTQQAARLVQQTIEEITFAGQAQTILRWLNSLSESVIKTYPRLCVYHATALMFTHQLAASEKWLQIAEHSVQMDAAIESAEANAILGWVALLRSDIARVNGNLSSGVNWAQQALTLLPESEVLARGVAVMDAAHRYLVDGDVRTPIEELAEQAVSTVRGVGNLFATMISMTNLARLQVLQGRLRRAESTFAQAENLKPQRGHVGDLLNGAAYHIGLGNILRERNELAAANQHLPLGIELLQGVLSVDADVVTAGYIGLAKLRQAHGDIAGGLAMLEEFITMARTQQFYLPLLATGMAARVPLWLAQGNLSAVNQWVSESGLNAEDQELTYSQEAQYLVLAQALIAQGKAAQARGLLDRLGQDAEEKARLNSLIEVLILQALAWQQLGDSDQALTALSRALSLASPEGYVRTFVDHGGTMTLLLREASTRGISANYVAKLLAAVELETAAGASAEVEGRASGDYEALSERELEVLNLIADGASNREIAAALVVSLGTVKKHLNNIFLKLDAHSRTQAISTARKQNIL